MRGREPMACCFSNFKTSCSPTARNSPTAWRTSGATTASYVELMDHWDEVLPGKILRMQTRAGGRRSRG